MRDRRGSLARWAIALLAAGATACRPVPPRTAPLPGIRAESLRLPALQFPAGGQRIVFEWELEDGELVSRGEGVARIAPPDSVRLDFFLGGGMGAGGAILIGDSLVLPEGGEMARRLVPPPPLLWAAFGRLAIPASADTIATTEGAMIRADVGQPPAWRISVLDGRLSRVERIERDRIVEWVDRSGGERVRYRHEGARRTLTLRVTRTIPDGPYDAAIWSFPR